MRIVFDLDDTISLTINRDFDNAKPNAPVVDKIRTLKAAGHEIVVYTARGQNSCNGDLDMIERTYRGRTEDWLRRHDVPFDELLFGKPLGDLYVDDKALPLEAFIDRDVQEVHGNSGAAIHIIGDRVIKKCKDAQEQAAWYAEASKVIEVPKVYSAVLDTISLERIRGIPGNKKRLTPSDVCLLISCIYELARTHILPEITGRHGTKVEVQVSFDTAKLTARAENHLARWEYAGEFRKLFGYLNLRRDDLMNEASFCHGDFSLSNVIFDYGAQPILIDPRFNADYASYLIDLSKLRFSLDGGEAFLHGPEASQATYPMALNDTFDRLLEGCMPGREVSRKDVKALEAVHWIRLLNYLPTAERAEEAVRNAKRLEEEL